MGALGLGDRLLDPVSHLPAGAMDRHAGLGHHLRGTVGFIHSRAGRVEYLASRQRAGRIIELRKRSGDGSTDCDRQRPPTPARPEYPAPRSPAAQARWPAGRCGDGDQRRQPEAGAWLKNVVTGASSQVMDCTLPSTPAAACSWLTKSGLARLPMCLSDRGCARRRFGSDPGSPRATSPAAPVAPAAHRCLQPESPWSGSKRPAAADHRVADGDALRPRHRIAERRADVGLRGGYEGSKVRQAWQGCAKRMIRVSWQGVPCGS